VLEICRNENESTFQQNIGYSYKKFVNTANLHPQDIAIATKNLSHKIAIALAVAKVATI
jgi:hypothetical protein